jgi:SAM-dependent methyltransferase
MKNPWLDIPLADYEGHMALPHVAQACLLSDVFADALKNYSPESVAVLGCAGGNGFDRISPEITKRVIGVDINPEYIQEAQRRFGHRMPTLELIVGDVQADIFDFPPVDVVGARNFRFKRFPRRRPIKASSRRRPPGGAADAER